MLCEEAASRPAADTIAFSLDKTQAIDVLESPERQSLSTLAESIVRSAHIAIISVDNHRVVTSWNPAAELLLGYSAEEAVGRLTPDIWLPFEDVTKRALDLNLEFVGQRDPFLDLALQLQEDTREWVFMRRNGSRTLVRQTTTPIRAKGGAVIGFLFLVTDISEFRRASHEIRELNGALENTMSGWARLDARGQYLAVNKSFAETAGYLPHEMLGMHWGRMIHPDDLPSISACYQAMLANEPAHRCARGVRKDGSTFYKEVFFAPARNYLGEFEGSYCFLRDVTTQIEAERKLQDSEKRYRKLFELNPLPCWIYNPKTLTFVDVNKAAIDNYGYSREQFLSLKLSDIRVQEAKGSDSDFRFELVDPSSSWSWRSGPWLHRLQNGSTILTETISRDLSPTARMTVARDITEQRRSEVALRQSEAKLQEAQHIAQLGSWEMDAKTGQIKWSPMALQILGEENSPEEMQYSQFVELIHPEDRERFASAVDKALIDRSLYDEQFRLWRDDGEFRYLRSRGQYTSDSSPTLSGTVLDVTDYKTVQDRLQNSLTEKELLLKEIHHRVKNNLQVISCLLQMQAESIDNEPAADFLYESQRRVMAMALIHERLYGNSRMDRIDFGEYAKCLVDDLVNSYSTQAGALHVKFLLSALDLTIEQAIPCALILNEFVTNAIKYAYLPHTEGVLSVEFEQSPDGLVTLAVADRGRGLPQDFDWRKSNSLGLTIVNLLTKQLGGAFLVSSLEPGTRFAISFPKESCR